MRRVAAFVVLFFVSCTGVLRAQSTSASITGRVTDPSKALIVDAKVAAINAGTNVRYEGTTNGTGTYYVTNLPPGTYRIEVDKTGFKTVIKPDVVLYVQDTLEINFEMTLGSASETITVEAGGLNMNTTDGSVGTVIDSNFVANIPLNGRSFQDLISLTPGVVTQSPQANFGSVQSGVPNAGDFSVNGQRTESNNYIVDGISGDTSAGYPGTFGPGTAGNLAASTALGTTQSLLSVDALQEFRVESSTYSAEYGTSPGGQFSFVSRSGTDSYHGSVFEYLRNDVFDANDWFNDYFGVAKPPVRQNDFGGTLGGPVRIPGLYNGKGKSFFFFSYEGLRLVQPTEASQQYVPTDSLRASAASVLQPLMNAFPLPTGVELQIACNNSTYTCPAGQPVGTLVPSGLAPFVKAYSLPSTINSPSLRLDQSVGNRVHIFLRAAYTPSATTTRHLASLDSNIGNTQNYTAGLDIQASSAVSDQLRVGYSRAISASATVLDSFGGARPSDFAAVSGAPPASSIDLIVDVSGIGFTYENPAKSSNYEKQWNIADTVDWQVGHQAVKAGVVYRRIQSSFATPNPDVPLIYTSPNSIETNSADFAIVEGVAAPAPLFNQLALFVQDEWKVKPSLNLSLGLRWEIEPPPTSSNDVKPYPLNGNLSEPSTYILGTAGGQLYKTTWGNFAPRLGVAWKARGNPGTETVLRGGIGIFYDPGIEEAGTLLTAGVGSYSQTTLSGVPLPLTSAQLDVSLAPTPPYSGNLFVASNFRLPYTIEWNIAVQQALGGEQNLTLTYVGSNGRRLVEENYLSGGTLNPEFEQLYLFQSGLTSNYQALQAQFQRRLSHGLTALASYTWSHSLDYGSTGSNYGYYYLRGNSDFDVRNNFNAALTWDLPLSRGNAFSKAVLNGWGLDSRIFARSAFPVPIDGNFYVNPVTGVGSRTGVDIVPGVPFYMYSPTLPGGRGINPNAFTSVAPGSIGDAPRNFLRGFGETQINLAVRRDFPLHENLKLQFRAEAFNILNHPNFGYIDPNLGDATFGQATTTLGQSLGTVNPLYQQGGARSMQFALKLVF